MVREPMRSIAQRKPIQEVLLDVPASGAYLEKNWRRSGKKNCGEEIKLSKIISPIQIFYVILQSDCKIT